MHSNLSVHSSDLVRDINVQTIVELEDRIKRLEKIVNSLALVIVNLKQSEDEQREILNQLCQQGGDSIDSHNDLLDGVSHLSEEIGLLYEVSYTLLKRQINSQKENKVAQSEIDKLQELFEKLIISAKSPFTK